MGEKISKLEVSKLKDVADALSNIELNEDLLSAQELEDVEGGFCNSNCVLCTYSGAF
jgi:hypothetical protein